MSEGWPEESLLPEQTVDDTDEGWGEDWGDPGDDDIDRFLREMPPHHTTSG